MSAEFAPNRLTRTAHILLFRHQNRNLRQRKVRCVVIARIDRSGVNPRQSSTMNDDLLVDLLAAVEQQLVSPQTKYVAKAHERLCGAGLTSEAAKEQIALCLGEVMDAMMQARRGFDEKAYREALDGLPLLE